LSNIVCTSDRSSSLLPIQLLDLYRVEEPRRGALLALLREA
jgi:hypothetical protein